MNFAHFSHFTKKKDDLNPFEYELDSPKDMFKLGASHTLETTHVEFFRDEDELEVDLRNITNSYTVPTTPNTRIHKDHPIKNVIGDVKSSIWTRRMTKSTSKQGFLSAEELLQFKLQQVWKLVDLPNRKRAIRTKWVTQKEDGIFISQDRYVAEILKKFNYTDVKSPSTLFDLEKPLVKDGDTDDVDVHLYRSMIGSLMYLTASRPDIIYLKGKPTLSLWYSRDCPFELVAYTDSDWKRISDKKTKNQAKTDKTEHGMEKREKPKSTKVNPESQPQQSQSQEVIK
ncbi:hypothetical protein Tco_1186105 [Tanacetum coccineum]